MARLRIGADDPDLAERMDALYRGPLPPEVFEQLHPGWARVGRVTGRIAAFVFWWGLTLALGGVVMFAVAWLLKQISPAA